MLAAAIVVWPVRPEIGGVQGIIFWTALTFVASVASGDAPQGPDRLGRFRTVGRGHVPGRADRDGDRRVIAGTFDLRELRGRVPWYGMLNDRACFVIAAVSSGRFCEVLTAALAVDLSSVEGSIVGFVALLIAAAWYFAVNTPLSITVVHLRDGCPIPGTVWRPTLAASS